MKLYALRHEDGSVSVMQLIADHPVEHEISRSVFSSPVVEALPITEDQAAAIRAARPKPETRVSANATPISQVHLAEITLIKEENAELRAELNDFKARFDGFFERLAEEHNKRSAGE